MPEKIIYDEMSPEALQDMIAKAEWALKERQQRIRKDTISKIKEMASSIGVTVEFHDLNGKPSRKGKTVEVKYRHPSDHTKTWTGRGVQPTWMRDLINSGHKREEFLIG